MKNIIFKSRDFALLCELTYGVNLRFSHIKLEEDQNSAVTLKKITYLLTTIIIIKEHLK